LLSSWLVVAPIAIIIIWVLDALFVSSTYWIPSFLVPKY
jgi:hypothetical protein